MTKNITLTAKYEELKKLSADKKAAKKKLLADVDVLWANYKKWVKDTYKPTRKSICAAIDAERAAAKAAKKLTATKAEKKPLKKAAKKPAVKKVTKKAAAKKPTVKAVAPAEVAAATEAPAAV